MVKHEIEGNFEIGQKVYFIENNRIGSGEIIEININLKREGPSFNRMVRKKISYTLCNYHVYEEDKLFESKEKLCEHLMGKC